MIRKPPYQETTVSRKTTRARMRLFKAIGILLPFLLLILLEVLLRIFGYGFNPQLFIEYPSDKTYLVLNPDASKTYFINQAVATTGNLELFKKEKEANTLRIFVLGESTTIGYPYFHNGSFHRWLQYRLMHEFPEKKFEIINLSLTAVNSYTVLGFAREAVNYEPDAVMIYTGHNEYYGALGVGSTNKLGGNTSLVNLTLALRHLKLVQLMTRVYLKISGLLGSKENNAGKTRMEWMVADQQIPYGSEQFNQGIEQFKANVDATLKIFNQRHIPVFISNLVSNEKDLKPFVDLPIDSSNMSGFREKYSLGIASLDKKDSVAALGYFNEANKAYPSHASCNYYLGRLAYGKGDYGKAKVFFAKALNFDGLRFRAPPQLNEVIADLCKKYPNAHLVDAMKVFSEHSVGSIIGDELLLEHVHPNLAGYALLSDLFYEAIKKEGLISIAGRKEMSFTELLQRMPITSMDSLTGIYRIDHLKKSWPFRQTPAALPDGNALHSEEEKLAFAIAFQKMSWSDATQNLYRYYIDHRDTIQAKILAETLVLEYPTELEYYDIAANLCGELKDYENAIVYFKKSFELSPSFEKAKYLFLMNFMLDRTAEAIPYLDYAINTGPASLQPIKKIAIDILQLKSKLSVHPSDTSLLNEVAAQYLKMGNKEGAEIYINKVLALDAKNSRALALHTGMKK